MQLGLPFSVLKLFFKFNISLNLILKFILIFILILKKKLFTDLQYPFQTKSFTMSAKKRKYLDEYIGSRKNWFTKKYFHEKICDRYIRYWCVLARSEGLPLLLPAMFACVCVCPSAQVLQSNLIKLGHMDHWGT